ncbi:F-type H+-transporting ATP synthase subunit e [Malassezia restricta]|uniref:F-type H+-transporting ATP synthase subunit e n=1 Tax=Malassezia restricta TaxID=76775 RepID=UPI000DD0FADF|nr:F-type H+-transporting ATP synthase subunit e [Malassezia restricta]AXA49102.1 F-type H+-transporting ATP synthase subunit e [Malassezia restricta]
MSPTPVVNVVRYSALIAGIGYGIMHGQKLQAKYDDRVEKQAIKHREDQIKKAKEEYAKIRAAKLAPASPNAVVSDPEDPNFDLERLLKHWEEKL